MPIIELNIPESLASEWSAYANSAGISMEMLIQEATTHSVRNDRLGAEQARLQKLLRDTREVELLARQGKAEQQGTSNQTLQEKTMASVSKVKKEGDRSKEKNTSPTADVRKKDKFNLNVSETHETPLSDEGMSDAYLPNAYIDETDNIANIDLHIPRNI